MADQLPAGLSSPSAFISVRVHIFDRPTAMTPKYQLRVRLRRASTFADLLAEVTRRVLAADDTQVHDSLVANASLRYADGTELRLGGELVAQMRWDEAVYVFPRTTQPRPIRRPPSSASSASSALLTTTLPATPVKQTPGYPSARAAAAGVGSQPPRHPGRTHAATPSRPPRREIASQKATSASPAVSRLGGPPPGAGLLDSRMRARRGRWGATVGSDDNRIVHYGGNNGLTYDDDKAGMSAYRSRPGHESSPLQPFTKSHRDIMDGDKTTLRTASNTALQGASPSSHAADTSIYDVYDLPVYDDTPPSIKKATPLGKGTLKRSPSNGTSPAAVNSPSTPRTPREGCRALQDITSKDNRNTSLPRDGEEKFVTHHGKQSGATIPIKTEQGQANEKRKSLHGNYAFKQTPPSQPPLASQGHVSSKAGLYQSTAIHKPSPSAKPSGFDYTLDYIALSSDSDDIDDYEWEKIQRYGSPREGKAVAMAATMPLSRSRPSGSPAAEKKAKSNTYGKRAAPTASGGRTKPPFSGAAGLEPDDNTASVIPESPPSNRGAGQFSSAAGGEYQSDDEDDARVVETASDLSLDELTARNTRLNSGSPKKRQWITTRTRAGVKRKLRDLSDSESSEDDADEDEEEEDDDDYEEDEEEHKDEEEEEKEEKPTATSGSAKAATSTLDAKIKSEAADPEQLVVQPPPRPLPSKPAAAPPKRASRSKNVSPSRRGRRRRHWDNKKRGKAPTTAADENEQTTRQRIARGYIAKANCTSASTSLAGHSGEKAPPPVFTSSQQDGFNDVPARQGKSPKKAKKSRRKRYSGHYTLSS